MWNNKDDKVYRIYQVVEESTGNILPKKLRKNYITIRTENQVNRTNTVRLYDNIRNKRRQKGIYNK